MGLKFTGGSAPSTPAVGKAELYVDSADRKPKVIDEKGVVSVLIPWNPKESLLVNGGFDICQRVGPALATFTFTATGRTYAADRWGGTSENASAQYQRVDSIAATETGLNARFYGKYKKITSAGKMEISQVVEGVNSAPARGTIVRFQAKMRFSVAASMTARLGLLYLTSAGTTDVMPASFVSAHGAVGTDPTWGTNITALAPGTVDGGTVNGLGMDCVLTSAWVRYSATFTVPASAKNLIPTIWTNGQPAANDELNITEAGLYIGQEILDWNPRPAAQELALAMRYYQKSFALDTIPATAVGVAGAARVPCTTALAVATSVVARVQHVVPLFHALGTITFFNPSAANAFARNATLGTDATATSSVNPSPSGFNWNCTGLAAWAVGNDIGVHYTVEADY